MLRFFLIHIAMLWGLQTAAQAQSIVVAGDSVLAWNEDQGHDIATLLVRSHGLNARGVAVSGAQISHPTLFGRLSGLDIARQLRGATVDIVIIDGGANDLAQDCGCGQCDAALTQLIGPDGTDGEIPDLVRRQTGRGAIVLWISYYEAPIGGGPFSPCDDEFAEMDQRLEAMAANLLGLKVVELADVIDPATPGHYDADRIHPSPLGSARIAAHLARAINADN